MIIFYSFSQPSLSFYHAQLEFETKLKARALPRSSPNVATFAFGFNSVRLMLLL